MTPSFLALHGGSGVELTLLEYLYRVALYLAAFGGIAAVAFWSSNAVEAVRSALSASRGREGPDS